MFGTITRELMALSRAILHSILALLLGFFLMLSVTTVVLGSHFMLAEWLENEVCQK